MLTKHVNADNGQPLVFSQMYLKCIFLNSKQPWRCSSGFIVLWWGTFFIYRSP